MKKKISKGLYWTPRILSILFLLFLAMFSLDVFEPGLNAWQIIIGLFMHNIPVFILAIVLYFSWKREWIGGITFIGAGLLYILTIAIPRNMGHIDASQSAMANVLMAISWSLTIAGPAFLIGILFLINWYKKRK